ncbi:cryptochrome/photolyase family protein [Sessilibacter sp. MAH4]
MTQTEKTQLVWLRNDLRITDNPALYNASKNGFTVAVFCICEKQWQEHNDSPAKIGLIRDTLIALAKQLNTKNIPVKILISDWYANIPKQLAKLCSKLNVESIWFNNEYPVNEAKRDLQVEKALSHIGVNTHRFDGDVIAKPGSVVNGNGSMFQVFTPFANRWRKTITLSDLDVVKAPRKQSESAIKSDKIPAFGGNYREDLWLSDANKIHAHLESFIQNRESDYEENRDFPNINGTSTVSPYLTVGSLSVRECLNTLLKHSGHEALEKQWTTELIWREFYRHLMAKDKKLSKGYCFKPVGDNLPWNNDKLFDQWCLGQTGYPIVDAGMRQLNQTGWMHNRVRMIVAAFFTKLMRIDWHLGEAYFMQHLIDGDFASNNGGWQWSASVGADAVPYFRIFNPYRQSEKFDPNGDYIRRFVPELKSITDKKIHQPTDTQCATLNYPKPIVDYAKERKYTLDILEKTFKQI